MRKGASKTDESAASIDLVVVGAHLSGMPLDKDLVTLGATRVTVTRRPPDYRLFDIGAGKPGMLRTHPRRGAVIEA